MTIAHVAHVGKKEQMVQWAKRHKNTLEKTTLFGTGTTGGRLEDEVGLTVTKLASGPLGGDAQLGHADLLYRSPVSIAA